jgi:hypothetical protein
MPREVLASAKHHTTFAVSPTLKSFSRGWSISLIYARRRHIRVVVIGHDKGGHIQVKIRGRRQLFRGDRLLVHVRADRLVFYKGA